MRKTTKRLDAQAKRIQQLEWDIQLKELEIKHLADAVTKLDKVLVESGILEYNWEPTAPKGSLIHPTNSYQKPAYTKVNKVF
jgi:hypothetical protein